MIVYAESSAVLALLLGADSSWAVRSILADAAYVVSSDLTIVECDRSIYRAYDLEQLTQEQLASQRQRLRSITSSWVMLRLNEGIIATARGAIPGGPIRSLDALHLASAIYARMLMPETVVLTLDQRVEKCAVALGFATLPSAS